MGRPLSPFIHNFFIRRAAMDARAYNTHVAFEITLKTGAKVPLSTASLVMTTMARRGASVALDPAKTFNGKILTAPEIQFSQDDAADGSTNMTISNLDYLLTALIPEDDRLFDGATVVVYICFPKPDGTFEGLIYGVGRLRSAEGDHEFAPVSYVSDVSDPSVTAGGRELTQRCLNIFRVMNGRSWCGAASDPNIPDGATCSKVFDDRAGGCAKWGQQATFQGISFFNPNGLVENYGGGAGGSGWIEPNWSGCPDVESWFKDAFGNPLHGSKVARGTILKDHLGRITVVEKVERIWSDFRYRIESPSGASLVSSASHMVLTAFDDPKGVALYSLVPSEASNMGGRIVGTREKVFAMQRKRGIITSSEIAADEGAVKIVEEIFGVAAMTPFHFQIASAGFVLKLSLTAPNECLVGETPDKYFGMHNLKPMFTGLEIQY